MIAYDRLSQIVPADQALACKALQVSLQQINNIARLELSTFANSVSNIETTRDLPLIEAQQRIVPPDVVNYILTNLGLGTGECGSILTVDCLGTAIGQVNNDALTNVTAIINTTDVAAISNVYVVMQDTLDGVYTEVVVNPFPPPDDLFQVVIPSGTPGEGTYGPYEDVNDAINDAFANGLIPAGQAACSAYVLANPVDAAQMNSDFANICQQMGNEQDLQVRAGLDFANNFANLVPNLQSDIFGFVFNLPEYGSDLVLGGTRTYLEGVANTETQTGQALVGSLREGPNQIALDAAGIQSVAHIPVTPAQPQPQGTFIPSTYTPEQARAINKNYGKFSTG
jgi:hypothetical protein